MAIVDSDVLTPREAVLMEAERDENKLARQFELDRKRLEIELAKLDLKWGSWLKIPLTIIKLPVYILFGVAYVVAVARKHEPSDSFWRFLR